MHHLPYSSLPSCCLKGPKHHRSLKSLLKRVSSGALTKFCYPYSTLCPCNHLSEFAGGIHDAHIPPEHKLKRLDLPRHTEVAVVTGADHIEGVALNLLAPLRPKPRRPPRPGDRQDFQNRQGECAECVA